MTFWFEAAPISCFFEIYFSWSHPRDRPRALSAEGGAPAPACSKYDGTGAAVAARAPRVPSLRESEKGSPASSKCGGRGAERAGVP